MITIFTIIGTLPGLYTQIWIVKKTGRIQFTVLILLCFLIFCMVTILPLSIIEAMRASDDGEDISSFNSFCE